MKGQGESGEPRIPLFAVWGLAFLRAKPQAAKQKYHKPNGYHFN
jgi:hypothetical protein